MILHPDPVKQTKGKWQKDNPLLTNNETFAQNYYFDVVVIFELLIKVMQNFRQ